VYVDFAYYSGTYGGALLTEADFPSAVREAENYIRYLTYVNGDIFADKAQADAVKGAVCAAAEACYTAGREQEQGGNLKSESKDGLSVSFVVARKDEETVEQYVKRCMYGAVRSRLLPTGWLSRRGKVGDSYDYKCGCCDCL
jgi:hypothetical protein